MSEPTAVKRTRHFTPAVFWPSVALILVFVLLAAAAVLLAASFPLFTRRDLRV